MRPPPFYFAAGTYTITSTVDDGITWRLVPQSGAAFVSIGSFGSFTVPAAGNYVMGGQLYNGEYCASITITGFSPMSAVYAAQ